MSKYLVISTDSHAGARFEDYRSYLDPEYRGRFDEWVTEKGSENPFNSELTGGELFSKDFLEEFRAEEAVKTGGLSGAWDHGRRMQEMDADGVAAEVIFPDRQNRNQPPFDALESPGANDPELQLAGARAYNRWLADFCSQDSERHAGVALITIDDIDVAVKEIEWAKQSGLRGGVLLPTICDEDPRPFYGDRVYEPIWATCQDLDMPVHSHGGTGSPNYYGMAPGSTFLYLYEQPFFTRRLLAALVLGGVFERHPKLRFILADQGCRWIAGKLAVLDYRYEGLQHKGVGEKLSFKPSEYWARNCWATASAMDRTECDARYALGHHKIMWGSNYPEVEGTWPRTREKLKATFAGVPKVETGAILGQTAARVYGFDLARLAPIVDRVGPEVSEL